MKNPLLISLGNKPRRGIIKKCRTCGKEFYVMPCQIQGYANRVSCSAFCQRKFKRSLCINLPNEEWRACNLLPEYFISNKGRIKDNDNFIAPQIYGHRGYYQFRLKQKRNLSVHRLVALAFIPNPENKPCINHINGTKTDNRTENLEWCTYQENTKHAIKTGLRGEYKNGKKLNKDTVRKLLLFKMAYPLLTNKTIGKKFGIKQPMVSLIINKKRWANVNIP